MKILRLDHVGIAVRDAAEAKEFFEGALSLRRVSDETWKYDGTSFHWVFIADGRTASGRPTDPEGQRFGVRLELMSSPDSNAFTNLFISRRGEGLHHLTFAVEEMAEAIDSLSSSGVRLREIETGDLTWKLTIIEPDQSPGLLVLLAQYEEDFWMYPSREGPVLQDLYGATHT